MVAHAAGESFYLFSPVAHALERLAVAHTSGREKGGGHAPGEPTFAGVAQGSVEQRAFSPKVGGSTPSPGSMIEVDRTMAVILGARNERKLERLRQKLLQFEIPHVAITEPDPPYAGQLMAIGLVPTDKDKVEPYLRDYHLLPERERGQL
jgi:hypothetical protein